MRFQHAFENLEDSAKDGVVDEFINSGQVVFVEVVKSQWGSYCIQHSKQRGLSACPADFFFRFSVLEHGSEKHKALTVDHLIGGLLERTGFQRLSRKAEGTRWIKSSGECANQQKGTSKQFIRRYLSWFYLDMFLFSSGRRAIIVDLALTVPDSQRIAALPTVRRSRSSPPVK